MRRPVEEWHTPWGGPPAVFSMASDGTDLYVSVHVGGILRSADGGSWVPTIDLHDDVHQVAVGADATVWAATGRRGLAESRDRGRTWQYHTEGLHARYLLTVATVGDGVLVGASSGHAGRDGAIYRFDGRRFERCRGLPGDLHGAVGPRQLAADGDPRGGRVARRSHRREPRLRARVEHRGDRRDRGLRGDAPRPAPRRGGQPVGTIRRTATMTPLGGSGPVRTTPCDWLAWTQDVAFERDADVIDPAVVVRVEEDEVAGPDRLVPEVDG